MFQLDLLDEIIVDNFAGGGGASTGIELAAGRPVDIAINHDPDAILMHATNHPYTQHWKDDVWAIDPRKICAGRKVGLAWFSPDCKHFSRAKGGKPVDKNIRGLAWVAVKWARYVHPRVIMLENVPEFQTWCPLGKDNKPIKSRTGETFRKFVRHLQREGYQVKWTELTACDYGAPTIRHRFFLVARNDEKPIVFPAPTHGTGLAPYKTAADCIDWNIPCKSIFGRSKPLADNTMRRIARGLDKFTIKAMTPFIMSNNTNNACHGTEEPVPTVTTGNRNFYCSPHISKYYGGVVGQKIADPLGTVTAIDHNALCAPLLIQYHTEQGGAEVRGQALNSPLMTVDASPRYALTAAHIVKYYSGADQASDVNDPLHTITTRERNALVESHLCILRHNEDCRPLDEPLPTITTSGAHFAEVRTSVSKYSNAENIGNWAEIREMLNKYCGYSLKSDEIILFGIGDALYFLNDIGMRMLEPRELYTAQGFPPDYIIERDYTGKQYPRSKQVARCGNAVPPPFAEALVRENIPEWCGEKITSMEQLSRKVTA